MYFPDRLDSYCGRRDEEGHGRGAGGGGHSDDRRSPAEAGHCGRHLRYTERIQQCEDKQERAGTVHDITYSYKNTLSL